MLRTVIGVCLLVSFCGCAFGLGQDQLYTGDARTVAPGRVQYQLFFNTTYKAGTKLGGTSFTFGATRNADVRISYSYLWNYHGPDVRLGPSIGAKWRFVGNGTTNPSVSLSGLYAFRQALADKARANDVGALLIVQYPTRYCTLLANLGRAWVSGPNADARYVALAAGKMVTPRVLAAAQYINLSDLGGGPRNRKLSSYVGAVVYLPSRNLGYSLQVGYSPAVRVSRWSTTLGFSDTF